MSRAHDLLPGMLSSSLNPTTINPQLVSFQELNTQQSFFLLLTASISTEQLTALLLSPAAEIMLPRHPQQVGGSQSTPSAALPKEEKAFFFEKTIRFEKGEQKREQIWQTGVK